MKNILRKKSAVFGMGKRVYRNSDFIALSLDTINISTRGTLITFNIKYVIRERERALRRTRIDQANEICHHDQSYYKNKTTFFFVFFLNKETSTRLLLPFLLFDRPIRANGGSRTRARASDFEPRAAGRSRHDRSEIAHSRYRRGEKEKRRETGGGEGRGGGRGQDERKRGVCRASRPMANEAAENSRGCAHV